MKKSILIVVVFVMVGGAVYLSLGRFSDPDIDVPANAAIESERTVPAGSEVTPRQDRPSSSQQQETQVVSERPREAQDLRSEPYSALTYRENEFPPLAQMSEDELDALEDFFDEAEDKWADLIEDMIMKEFGLSEQVLRAYEDIRDEFEDARWDAFEQFHEELFGDRGVDADYRLSEYHQQVERPLAEEYRHRVREILGESHYRRYIEALENFNEDLRSRQDPRLGIILILL